MCGIIGYITDTPLPYAGTMATLLRRLEYRGYDSAGAALLDTRTLVPSFAVTKIANEDAGVSNGESCATLVERLAACTSSFARGIAHTRWATHGTKVARNCHPHMSYDSSITVVHNGTIDNFAELREEIIAAGITLTSETDTEIISHLIARVRAALCHSQKQCARYCLGSLVRMGWWLCRPIRATH
jgi:glutamine---fructose-6-phosphate transaminase (isomerizing)